MRRRTEAPGSFWLSLPPARLVRFTDFCRARGRSAWSKRSGRWWRCAAGPAGWCARMVTPQTASAMADTRDKGVNFRNWHALFPPFPPANVSAMATGHYLGDTGAFTTTIYTGFTSVPAGDTVVPFLENDAV